MDRFKEFIRKCAHHGLVRTFYNGLVSSLRNKLDASSGGALLSESYEERYKFNSKHYSNTYKWPVTRAIIIVIPKKPPGVHKVT